METRVPVMVLSGFLGSGKTTLLNRLLREPGGRRVAVIVNEFGEIGIDGRRLAGAEQFVELDNGCLCCALNADLKKTLFDLRDRGGFEHLVIETTGLADPLPIAWTFSRPGLDEFYRVDSLVTVVDAVNFVSAAGDVPEAGLQVERADLLVLNKLDLVEDEGRAVREALRHWNERAPILGAERGEVAVDALLSEDAGRELLIGDEVEALHAGHEVSFETHCFATEGFFDAEALEDFLEDLPETVYRVKGLVRTDQTEGWTLINGVAGRLEFEPFAPLPEPTQSALVWIGRSLPRDRIDEHCRQMVKV